MEAQEISQGGETGLKHPPKPAKSWKLIEVVSLVVTIIGTALGLFAYFEARINASQARRIEADSKLDEAWDLLGGQPRAKTIKYVVKDPPKLQRARIVIAEAVLKNPDYPRVHLAQGYFFYITGKTNAAVASFTKALEIDAKLAEAHYNLGTIAYELAEQRDFPKYWQKQNSYKKQPQEENYFTRKHSIELLEFELKEARASFQQSKLHELEKAEVSFQKAVLLDPGFAEAYCNLGIMQFAQGKLLELQEGPKDRYRVEDLDRLTTKFQKFKEASASFDRAMTINPNLAEVHNAFGVAEHQRSARFEEPTISGEQNFRYAIALAPDFVEAHYNLAVVLKEKYLFSVRDLSTHREPHSGNGWGFVSDEDLLPGPPSYSYSHPASDPVRDETVRSFQRAIQLKPGLTTIAHLPPQSLGRHEWGYYPDGKVRPVPFSSEHQLKKSLTMEDRIVHDLEIVERVGKTFLLRTVPVIGTRLR